MSSSGSRGMLVLATRQLQARWAETRHSWRDDKAAQFDDLYLAELAVSVTGAVRVLEELEKLLERIHADCD